MPFILYFLFFLPLQFLLLDITSSVAAGSIVNVTIDDTLGDSRTNLKVQYSESTSSAHLSSANNTGWKHQTSQSCNDCQVKAICQNDDDVCTRTSMTPLNGTKVTVTFQFNGSAVYIYFAPAHSTSSGNKPNANSAEFLLNGQHSTSVDLIQQHNSSAGDWLVYSISSIPFGLHQFSIQLSYPSSAVFDYAVYTDRRWKYYSIGLERYHGAERQPGLTVCHISSIFIFIF
ncbi:hypothetical protein K435DRAFT_82762 [Dendrothele bispora CBS 962.96]|uniref:Uncharacterized protein n=1 Tax=Dendrothele bispora (strain CBS 962.96) TaxID=1314807 RepID=A0A4S8KPQ0_DENBC|nr:hypothetical protein K435DRAFT_82762 [Dendrothele bispora CBS 962.96]